MQFTISSDYAVRIIYVLSLSGGKSMTAAQIGGAVCTSTAYVQRIAAKLRDAHILSSAVGYAGERGYRLIKNPEEITLYEVIAIMEQTMNVNRCLEPDHYCSRKGPALGCPVREVYTDLQEQINRTLTTCTFKQLIQSTKRIY